MLLRLWNPLMKEVIMLISSARAWSGLILLVEWKICSSVTKFSRTKEYFLQIPSLHTRWGFDTTSKEMMYLFGKQNEQSLDKLKHVETNCLSAEWKGLRTQAVSKSKNGKLLKSHYFYKKTFLWKEIKCPMLSRASWLNSEKKKFSVYCAFGVLSFASQ